MKILVTGRDGQLARSLHARSAGAGHDVAFVGRPDFDLVYPESIARVIDVHRPDAVINAAAYTSVDRAEDEPDMAYQVNGVAPGLLAAAAAGAGAKLIHLSTDYVFDGKGQRPLDETTPTAPLGMYGRSKLAGEEAVRAASGEFAIIRTAWVYSPWGTNFVKTMLRLAKDRSVIRVVGDQFGSPTSALDLADGLLALLARWEVQEFPPLAQTYHLAGSGRASWAELAQHVMETSAKMGGPTAHIEPIQSSQYPTRAARPRWSVLDSSLFAEHTGYRMPDWRPSVASTAKRLLETAS